MLMVDILSEVLEYPNVVLQIFTEVSMKIVYTTMGMGSSPYIPLKNNANNAQDFIYFVIFIGTTITAILFLKKYIFSYCFYFLLLTWQIKLFEFSRHTHLFMFVYRCRLMTSLSARLQNKKSNENLKCHRVTALIY